MGFWSDFGRGISSHISALEFIAKHKLWLYFLFPVLLVGLLFLAGFASVYSLGDLLVDKAFDWLEGYSDTGMGWIDSIINVLLWLLSVGLKFFFRMYFFSYILKVMRYIVLICCSPMMALLSERVDEIITGRKYPFRFGHRR